jgi:hypothetical protein
VQALVSGIDTSVCGLPTTVFRASGIATGTGVTGTTAEMRHAARNRSCRLELPQAQSQHDEDDAEDKPVRPEYVGRRNPTEFRAHNQNHSQDD